MAITIDFAKKYEHLICRDIPKMQLHSYPYQNPVPEKHRKNFIHTADSFVKKFCEDYNERKETK